MRHMARLFQNLYFLCFHNRCLNDFDCEIKHKNNSIFQFENHKLKNATKN